MCLFVYLFDFLFKFMLYTHHAVQKYQILGFLVNCDIVPIEFTLYNIEIFNYPW